MIKAEWVEFQNFKLKSQLFITVIRYRCALDFFVALLIFLLLMILLPLVNVAQASSTRHIHNPLSIMLTKLKKVYLLKPTQTDLVACQTSAKCDLLTAVLFLPFPSLFTAPISFHSRKYHFKDKREEPLEKTISLSRSEDKTIFCPHQEKGKNSMKWIHLRCQFHFDDWKGKRASFFSNTFLINSILICLWFLFPLLIVQLLNTPR